MKKVTLRESQLRELVLDILNEEKKEKAKAKKPKFMKDEDEDEMPKKEKMGKTKKVKRMTESQMVDLIEKVINDINKK